LPGARSAPPPPPPPRATLNAHTTSHCRPAIRSQPLLTADPANRSQVCTFGRAEGGHTAGVTCLAFPSAGRARGRARAGGVALASGSLDGSIKLWGGAGGGKSPGPPRDDGVRWALLGQVRGHDMVICLALAAGGGVPGGAGGPRGPEAGLPPPPPLVLIGHASSFSPY